MAQVILASASPRRRELLDQIGVSYQVQVADVDERVLPGEAPLTYVERIAAAKSAVIASRKGIDLPVLAADTAVVFDQVILGKPIDEAHAVKMLLHLSGRTHDVYTAVSLRGGLDQQHLGVVSITKVTFRQLRLSEIIAYWKTGEPCDKAGAYAIQGLGGIFVAGIVGSFSGVVGLPIFETASLLQQVGIKLIHD